MNAPSERSRKIHQKTRQNLSSLEEQLALSEARSTESINDHELIEIVYDDGYPAGQTTCDNRDIWEDREDGAGKRLIFKPRTLGAWLALVSLRDSNEKWSFNFTDLQERLKMCRDTLRATLAELEAKGRLERLHVRKPNGTYGRQRWVLHRGGRRGLPPSKLSTRETPVRAATERLGNGPATKNQAPVSTSSRKPRVGPATENQAPASTSPRKPGDGPATENQAPASTSSRKPGDEPATENQAPASTSSPKPSSVPASDAEATDYTVALKSGAGVSAPLVTTEVVKNKETTTTTRSSSLHELVPPTSLPPDEARVVVAEVEKAVRNGSLRGDLAQPVLDELEGAIRRGRQGTPIAKPVSYLRSLLQRAQTGQFVPDAGLPIGRERQKQVLEVENRVRRDEERRQHVARRDDPEAERRILALIDECSRALKIPPRAPRDAGPQLKTSASP